MSACDQYTRPSAFLYSFCRRCQLCIKLEGVRCLPIASWTLVQEILTQTLLRLIVSTDDKTQDGLGAVNRLCCDGLVNILLRRFKNLLPPILI